MEPAIPEICKKCGGLAGSKYIDNLPYCNNCYYVELGNLLENEPVGILLPKYKIRGKFNDILSQDIGENTIINGWTFIGKDVKIGNGCMIGNFVELNSGTKIGDGTNIQPYCVTNSNTIIGKYCHFGGGVMTADEKHMSPFTDRVERESCIIGDYVKIGQGSMLICCKIGNHSRVGAGSVVLKDIPENEVWAGVPAKKIRDVTDHEINDDYPNDL